MSPARVVFVNRFAGGDPHATARMLMPVAGFLARAGLPAAVHAGPACGEGGVPEGVEVIRHGARMWSDRSLAGKLLNQLAFTRALRRARPFREGDTAVLMTDPAWLPVLSMDRGWPAGVRRILWTQDIHPEATEVAYPVPLLRPLYRRWRRRRDAAWARASALVAISPGMREWMMAHGVPGGRIHVIENFPLPEAGRADDAAVAAFRREQGWEGRFVVMYSGNFGRLHDLSGLPGAAALLADDPRFLFVCAGGGPSWGRLRRAAGPLVPERLRFFPRQPVERLAALLAAADVHLVALRPESEDLVFPSKVYGALAAGRPLLHLGDAGGSLARWIAGLDAGLSVAAGDAGAIAGAVRRLAGRLAGGPAWGATLAETCRREYSLDAAGRRWLNMLGSPPPET